MSGLPYMKLYWDDLLANTYHMTPEAFGAYLRLLGYQWSNGSIPKNPKRLRTITGVDPADWAEVWEQIGDKFEAAGEGAMVNARMEKERAEVKEGRQKMAEAGREGARRRWGKGRAANRDPIGDPIEDPSADPNRDPIGDANGNSEPRSLSKDRDHGFEDFEKSDGGDAREGHAPELGEEGQQPDALPPLDVLEAKIRSRREEAWKALAFQFRHFLENRKGPKITHLDRYLSWWLTTKQAQQHRDAYKPPLPSNAVSEEELAEMRAIREQRKAKKGQP